MFLEGETFKFIFAAASNMGWKKPPGAPGTTYFTAPSSIYDVIVNTFAEAFLASFFFGNGLPCWRLGGNAKMKMSLCFFSVLSRKKYSKWDLKITSVTFLCHNIQNIRQRVFKWRHRWGTAVARHLVLKWDPTSLWRMCFAVPRLSIHNFDGFHKIRNRWCWSFSAGNSYEIAFFWS